MSPALRERAAAMVERVALECDAVGVSRGITLVRDAVADALAVRDQSIADDHDARLLHPARNVLILISDGAVRGAEVLAAAAFVESLPDQPRADPARLTPEAQAILESVPTPAGAADELLERLVTADTDAALIAIAERLDHARHLHLMADIEPGPFLETIHSAYIPVAWRVCPQMAARLERWAGAFERRRARGHGDSAPRGKAASDPG